MTAPEFVHPSSTGLPEDFVRSLVDNDKLPVDIAFRSQWLPYEMTDGSGARVYGSHIVEHDILASTGHGHHTEFYDSYFSSSATPPPCVTIRWPYTVRPLIKSTDSDWHMFADYRAMFIDSDSKHPQTAAIRAWHNLILTALHNSGSSLRWVDSHPVDSVYKKNQTGQSLRNLVATTVIRDDLLVDIVDKSIRSKQTIPHDTVKTRSLLASAAQLLLADNYPDRFGRSTIDWQEEAFIALKKRTSALTFHAAESELYKRNGLGVAPTSIQKEILREKFMREKLGTKDAFEKRIRDALNV